MILTPSAFSPQSLGSIRPIGQIGAISRSDHFRSWVTIDHSALRHNLRVIKRLAGDAGIIAVVKANAYGHGLSEIVSTMRDHVAFFAVASLEEALHLRCSDQQCPILLLSAALPSEYPIIATEGFIPTISSFEEAKRFAKIAVPLISGLAPIHFKIDTGMGRLGVWHREAEEVLTKVARLPLAIQSLSTHLPAADSAISYTRAQLTLFKKLLPVLQKIAPQATVHVLNSAGLLRFPKHAYDFVRVGLMLYGVSPLPSFQKLFRPALSWKTTISLVHKITEGRTISYGCTYRVPRDLMVAVLPVGYGDGYPQQLSEHGAEVLIKGHRCPILGRVTMDQIMVDVTRIENVSVGNEAVLVGKQGAQEITVTELANKANTIAWHLFTGITERVHRIHC